MDILYYRINRKSNLILFEDLALQKTKSTLTSELDNTADKSLGQKMENIFNTIINNYKSKEEKVIDFVVDDDRDGGWETVTNKKEENKKKQEQRQEDLEKTKKIYNDYLSHF